jgi:hypothetical protein
VAADDRYRLAPVRDVRARGERARKAELADAIAGARAIDDALAAAQARVDAARAAVDACRRALAGSAVQVARADAYAARRRRELALALAELDRLAAARDREDGVVDGARRALVRARAERELIERHFARWRDERRKLAERRAD